MACAPCQRSTPNFLSQSCFQAKRGSVTQTDTPSQRWASKSVGVVIDLNLPEEETKLSFSSSPFLGAQLQNPGLGWIGWGRNEEEEGSGYRIRRCIRRWKLDSCATWKLEALAQPRGFGPSPRFYTLSLSLNAALSSPPATLKLPCWFKAWLVP